MPMPRRHGPSPARLPRLAAVALLAGLVAVLGAVPSASAAVRQAAATRSGGWTWYSEPHVQLNNVSCPTAHLCVGDDNTDVYWSTDPTSPHDWHHAQLESPTSPYVEGSIIFDTISCPSASFCVVADNAGNRFATTHPTGGKSAWSAQSIDDTSIEAISCASAHLCGALDYFGTVLTSSDPGSPTGAWVARSTKYLDEGADFYGISCAGTGLCAAVEDSGDIFYSANAASAAPLWHAVRVGGHGWDGIDCPTTARCVAAGEYEDPGQIAVSTDPDRGAWSYTHTAFKNSSSFDDVSCHTASFCLVQGDPDEWTTDPTAVNAHWHATTEDAQASEYGVSCPGATLCFTIGVGGFGYGTR